AQTNRYFAAPSPADSCGVVAQTLSFRPMWPAVTAAMVRLRLLLSKALSRLGFREDAFLLLLAVLIGIVAAAAAVGFHELIRGIRNLLYAHMGPRVGLYGQGIWLLILLPALGG